jgi:hypothetical protein
MTDFFSKKPSMHNNDKQLSTKKQTTKPQTRQKDHKTLHRSRNYIIQQHIAKRPRPNDSWGSSIKNNDEKAPGYTSKI